MENFLKIYQLKESKPLLHFLRSLCFQIKINCGICIYDHHLNFPYTLSLLFFPHVEKHLFPNHRIKSTERKWATQVQYHHANLQLNF